jgi:hypothetical protein
MLPICALGLRVSSAFRNHNMDASETCRLMIDVRVKPNSTTISSILHVLVAFEFFKAEK